VESPFAPRGATAVVLDDGAYIKDDAQLNLAYAKSLCRYLALQGLAPYASHLFCTQFLDDTVPAERQVGIEIGLEWGSRAELTIVGVDRGISKGMLYGIDRARKECRPVEWLSLTAWRSSWLPDGVDREGWLSHALSPEKLLLGLA